MIYGIDALGGAKYPDVVMRIPAGFAVGIFAQEFGDAFPLVQKLARTGRYPVIRVQLCWSPNHQYTTKHLAAAIKEAKRYNTIKGQSAIQLSPFCEHQLQDPDPWLDQVHTAAPSCTIVNNPINGKGALSKKYANEIHTGKPPSGPYNFSYDGQSSCDADTEADKARYSNASIFFFWTWQLNCHYNGKDKTRQTRPTVELIRGLANLVNARGNCNLPGNTLWKSFAEQSDPDGDNRSNKPMCISPIDATELQLVRGGKVVAKLPRYPTPFVDGRNRFYLTSAYGYQVATEPIQLKAGSKLIGIVNPGFRFGNFRGE